MESCLQPRGRIDEEERVIDDMFLAEFGEEHLGNRLIPRRRELDVQQAVRVGIDSSVQLEPFVVEVDHGFINRDVIRICAIDRL